jgi:hypothetical protein
MKEDDEYCSREGNYGICNTCKTAKKGSYIEVCAYLLCYSVADL